MMFNFQNMNDYEFELLCKDILEIELGNSLRTYGKGKDQGVDVSCFLVNGIVVQVKHYINSTFAHLFSSLKKELSKVKSLNPKDYYICTSLRLTPSNISDIYKLFEDFMSSPKNIYDGTIIDNFLSKESNIDVVNKHYKLWLTSSNILNLINNKDIFIDTDELMVNIENEISLFVETKSYYNAIKVLDEENMIIIVGDPGVGKTTISKMLLFHYFSNNYCVRYASNNSIDNIKKALSRDALKKEIVLMDDFLGQHYLSIKEDQPNEIKSLISYVLRNKNKKLILNSRITIINEALRKNFQLKNFLDDNKIKRYRIDLNQMSILEKAKIFYNHMFFNRLPVKYFNSIKRNMNYFKIVEHKNYNPRIIEYVTKERNYKKCEADEYYDYIINKLENPLDVWEDEFNNRMESFDRIFMHTLYSLTDTYVGEEILKNAFNRRIKYEQGYDSTRDMFSECLKRLSQSMIRIIDEKKQKKIGVLNPSINDYMFYRLNENENEVEQILNYSIYIEQSNKISKVDENKARQFKLDLIKNDRFLSMKTIARPVEYFYIEYIFNIQYKNYAIRDTLIEIISNSKTYINISRNETSKLLCKIFSNKQFFEFYNLKELLFDFNIAKVVFDELIFEDIVLFLSIYKKYYDNEIDSKDWVEGLKFTLEEFIDRCIHEKVEEDIEDDLHDIIHNAIVNADEEDIYNYLNGYGMELKEMIYDDLIDKIKELIEDKKNEIDIGLFSVDDLNIPVAEDILEGIDYNSEIDKFFQEDLDYDKWDFSSGKSNYNEIQEIFNREYSPPN